mgnify:CR=1 FL=1
MIVVLEVLNLNVLTIDLLIEPLPSTSTGYPFALPLL